MGLALGITRWFERLKRPKHEFVAYAVMLSWHPAIGFAAHDPLSGRHIAHRPGTSVINNFPSPTKLAADYFPVTLSQGSHLPRELAGKIEVSRSVNEQTSGGMVERYEMKEANAPNAASFVFQRSISPDGSIGLKASFGDLSLSHRHEAVASHRLNPYLEALRGLARRVIPANKMA